MHTDGERDIQMVPQPNLSGATDQISAEDVQQRLERRAEELKNDTSLTEVRNTYRFRVVISNKIRLLTAGFTKIGCFQLCWPLIVVTIYHQMVPQGRHFQ